MNPEKTSLKEINGYPDQGRRNSYPKKIIFVVGNSRSGTTLMGSILGNNPEIFTFEELHFFDQLWSSERQDEGISRNQAKFLVAKLFGIQASDFLTPQSPELFYQDADKVLDQLEGEPLKPSDVFSAFLSFKARYNKKQIPCEQTPQNVFYIRDILDLYSDCRIINMVRDPRDVLLSQKYKWKIRFLGASNIPYQEAFRAWANYHPVIISKLWTSSIQAAEQFKDHPQVINVRFEDLIQKPRNVIEEVCDFSGLTFNADMLNVSQAEGGVSSHKKVSSSKGIDSSVVGKWRNGKISISEIHICQTIANKYMDIYGYTLNPTNFVSKLLSVLLIISLPAKLSLALCLNIHRAGNLLEAIRKRM